ncbi:MAG: hypothetical protein K8H88_29435, partial [Sandaracinaceae bacterium]|nr:hypothetical protein [Sandaracinaceae bacterium]
MEPITLEQRYAEARQLLLAEFAARWTRRKPLIMTLYRAIILAVFVFAGLEAPRLAGVLVLFALMTVLDVVEALRMGRRPATELAVTISTAVSLLLAGAGCAFTGGYASLLLPGLLIAVVIPPAAFGRRAPTWILFGELVALLALLLVLPLSITGRVLPAPWIQIGLAASISIAVWVSVTNIVTLTELSQRAAMMAGQMRDQLLAQHEGRARTLETMGAKVAHEIKNPLAAIAGLVQLLLKGSHDDKTRERLMVIESEVQRTERVVREYLAFSRPLDELRATDTDLGALVDDVLALLEARARRRSVKLERRGARATAKVDPARLREALLNLVDNAIEASSAGDRVSV